MMHALNATYLIQIISMVAAKRKPVASFDVLDVSIPTAVGREHVWWDFSVKSAQ